MVKRSLFVFIVLALLAAGVAFYFSSKAKKVSIISQNTTTSQANINAEKKLFITGWIPYWRKAEGAASLQNNLNLFSEIHPFAFGVSANGSLTDTLKITAEPWPQLRDSAQKENVAVVPTILWGDAGAMHKVFSDNNLLDQHINNISEMLARNNFTGVDIDYEGKDVADRERFSNFLQKLHDRLKTENKTLNCTVEARTQDSPPVGFTGTRAMSFANDFSVLNAACDSVTVMAYDEAFQIHRANTFEDINPTPTAPDADSQWVEQVVNYALRYIAPEKLILGVPTYGWEFQLTKLSAGYRYTRVKSISYPDALAEAKAAGVTPITDSGGELSFVYQTSDGEHIVTFADAAAVQQKIELAKKLNLKGISLFKLDGLTDPGLFPVLQITLGS